VEVGVQVHRIKLCESCGVNADRREQVDDLLVIASSVGDLAERVRIDADKILACCVDRAGVAVLLAEGVRLICAGFVDHAREPRISSELRVHRPRLLAREILGGGVSVGAALGHACTR
jgi:hypothetical protein